jgi:glycosyltransferase involved in cell wall biosynthesis
MMMPIPEDTIPSDAPPKIDLALCVDPLSLRRFRASLRYLCVGLLDVSAQVRLVTSSPEAESLMLGSVRPVLYQDRSWPFRRYGQRRVLSALAGRVPNIVHGVSARALPIASAIARHFDAHLIVHVLSLDDVEELGRVEWQPIDCVVAASQPIYDAILEGRLVTPDKVQLIRLGTIASETPSCFLEPQRLPTVLCTNQLTTERRVDRLLDALRLLRERGHEFMAFLTGTGPLEHALRQRAQAAGLAPVVTFAQPLGEVRQIMGGADIFVRPAVERELSVRTLQAMAAGMAVVTVEGGAADAHLDGVTGLVCPDYRPISLAAAIERLLLDRAFARTLASRAVQHIKKHHSVSVMCDALMRIYYDLALRDQTISVGR